jgi:site-specific DNA-methyltransferase (adenine-specific)
MSRQEIGKIKLLHGDCLQEMNKMPDKSIDMVLCDLPYDTTACGWDKKIPFDKMWEQYKRIIKDGKAIVLTASQPFTSALIMSNISWFKYEWIWEKAVGSNFATLKWQPMKEHESVLVFGKGRILYNPQMEERSGAGKDRIKYGHRGGTTGEVFGSIKFAGFSGDTYGELRYPRSVQFFNNREQCRGLHPTQKPVEMMKYFIRTYTNAGDVVLDNCMGSGTTGVACIKERRSFIGIEVDEKYFNTAQDRIKGESKALTVSYV